MWGIMLITLEGIKGALNYPGKLPKSMSESRYVLGTRLYLIPEKQTSNCPQVALSLECGSLNCVHQNHL